MGFIAEALAGDKLVRFAIQSPNYVPGDSGWTINRDGTAEFNDVIARGTITATDFRSNNYSPGVSGFDLNAATNTIEINTGFRIGGSDFGEPGGQHIELGLSGGLSQIRLYTGSVGTPDQTEVVPGSIETGIDAGFPVIEIDSPATTNGHIFMEMAGSTPTLAGGVIVGTTAVPLTGKAILSAQFTVQPNMQMVLASVQGTAGGEQALITGDQAGTHVRYSGSEIQAIAAGPVTAPLNLNPSGGNVNTGQFRGTNTGLVASGAMALLTGNASGTHLRYSGSEIGAYTGGVNPATLTLNPAGGGVTAPDMISGYIQGGNVTTPAAPFGPATIVGSPTLTLTAPPSGAVMVTWAANVASSLAGGEFLIGLEVRQTNAGGAVLYSSPNMVIQNNGAGQQNTGSRTVLVSGVTGVLFMQLLYQGAGTAASVGTIRIPTIATIPSL